MSYNRLERNVVLVPVNNSPFPSQGTDRSVIVKRLNEIYGPAVVNWNVSIDAAIEVLNIKETDFMVEGTALLSKYTSDMNRVIRTYKRDRVTDDNTLYLFFMTLSNLGSSRKGFMPLAGNYGFIFNFEAQDLELLAHELAHGAFNLRHTFSDKSVYYFTVNQTANLMDYAGGVELWKYQWDLIHNPESILFAWGQDESEGAMIGKGKLAIFDGIYEDFEKYTLSFEGENYKIPYPYNKNIVDQTDKSNTSYIYVDYDLDQMLKVREIFRKQYYNIKDVDALNTLIENDVDAWKDMVKSDVPQHNINSPMTVKAINQNRLNIIDFEYLAIISQFDERWGNKNWDFTGTLDNSKKNRQSFALASIQGNVLDMESFYQLNDDVLYQIDYKKHYNQRNEEVLYNKEELRYWCYGYYLAKMNFSYREAISLGMQFFNALSVNTFESGSRTSDLPWRVDALLDGYSCYYSDNNLDIISVPYIDMYQLYSRNAGEYEFDIMWDLNDFTIDAILIVATDGGYSIGKTVVQRGTKFTMGAMVDISLQMAFLTLDGTSVEDAYEQVDWSSAVYSGVETFHSTWISASTMACMRNAFKEMGNKEYDYKKVLSYCGTSFFANALSSRVFLSNGKIIKKLNKYLSNNAKETISSFWALGLERSLVEWIVAKVLGDGASNLDKIIDNQYRNGKKK